MLAIGAIFRIYASGRNAHNRLYLSYEQSTPWDPIKYWEKYTEFTDNKKSVTVHISQKN